VRARGDSQCHHTFTPVDPELVRRVNRRRLYVQRGLGSVLTQDARPPSQQRRLSTRAPLDYSVPSTPTPGDPTRLDHQVPVPARQHRRPRKPASPHTPATRPAVATGSSTSTAAESVTGPSTGRRRHTPTTSVGITHGHHARWDRCDSPRSGHSFRSGHTQLHV
jgi:hypothetical protein